MKKLLLLLILSVFISSCAKDETPSVNDNTPVNSGTNISDTVSTDTADTSDTIDISVDELVEEAPIEEKPVITPVGDEIAFTTEDMNGNTITSLDFSSASIIIYNFWEPWCGPCVREMPDLEKLYENYADKGVIIVGIYSTFNQQEDVEAIVESKNITYPIIKCNDVLAKEQTMYVPTTVITDGNGNKLLDKPIIGSLEYSEWEEVVLSYLPNSQS